MNLPRRSLFALALAAAVFAPASHAQSALDAIVAKKSIARSLPRFK